jgi:hypothetical protein
MCRDECDPGSAHEEWNGLPKMTRNDGGREPAIDADPSMAQLCRPGSCAEDPEIHPSAGTWPCAQSQEGYAIARQVSVWACNGCQKCRFGTRICPHCGVVSGQRLSPLAESATGSYSAAVQMRRGLFRGRRTFRVKSVVPSAVKHKSPMATSLNWPICHHGFAPPGLLAATPGLNF